MTQLVLQLLGRFAVRDTAGMEIRITSRKGRALLAFLAAGAGQAHSRDRLAALLWEEADEELARTSLRQALAAVRKVLPADTQSALVSDADSLRLEPGLINTDIAQLRRSLSMGTRTALQDGLTHHRGDFLEGMDAKSTAYDEWLSTERQSLRRQLAEALQKLTVLCSSQGDVEGALSASARLVSLEPLNEAAHRTLMELHARRHAYADALRQYQICRDILRRELDVAPEPATEQLYRELMRRRRTAAVPATMESLELQHTEAAPARIDASTGVRRTGLRDAAVLVVRLEGLIELEATLEPEDAHRIGLDFQERVQAIAAQYQGCADRRVGSSVLVVFGATQVRGDEAEQAVRASLALRQSVNDGHWCLPQDLSLRMGIAQGQVLVSPALFPLTGRPIHTAHTLASLATDDGICIAPTIHNSLGAMIDAEALSGTGSPDNEGVWLLQSLRDDGHGRHAPLVGRRPELAMLVAMFDRCGSGRHGRAVVVRGEAGIGKTRLIHAVIAAVRETDAAVHASGAFDFGQSPGRRPVTTLALSLLGLGAEATGEARAAAVAKVIQANQGGIDQLIFLSDLVDAPLDSELAALENAMDTATRQRGRCLALAHLIESAASRSPLLLVIEDVHWTDQDELARFGEIAAIIAHCPALLIMTTRPEGDPIGAVWRARARGCPVTTVDLAPLADDEAQTLASHYANLSPEVVAACISRAEGNPLFLDQLFRAAFDGHDCLPGSVRALILARAERLSEPDRDALQASAVLGQRFSSAALRRLIDDTDFTPQALIQTALLREDDDFEFTHALFRDAIYESTLRSRRRELHRRAADWFATHDLALCADHLAAAEDPDAATAYLTAARSEQTASRFERALMLANKACTVARDPSQLHRTQCLLGELLLTLGRTHDALAAFREAIDFASDQRRQVDAWIGVASALRVMDRHIEALKALDRAENALGDNDDIQVRVRISTLRGNLCFPLGRIADCLREHERAMQLASASNSPADLAGAYSGLGDAWYQRGRMRTASEYFARCLTQSRNHNLPAVRMANLPMLALTRLYCGDAACTDQSLDEALELSRRLSDARSELLTQLVTSWAMLMRGRIDVSDGFARRARDLAEQLGARRFQAEAMSLQASCQLARERRSEADELVREALQLSRATSMNYCGPALLGVLARTTTLAEERRQALREGEELLASGCVSHSYFEFYFHAIEVSVREGLWSDAHRYADALAAYTQDEPLVWTELLIKRGRCLADLGRGHRHHDIARELQELRSQCNSLDLRLPLAGIDAALSRLSSVQV
ncbi:BTAD domain-containing putative transcriptional regulator [Povalibacter sp.]|uniref:BTAD domain-containing putative transcriptional regulator n=1 Tax=Povalibacter sp. TaxID=1962978 RepID=UPI002F428D76